MVARVGILGKPHSLDQLTPYILDQLKPYILCKLLEFPLDIRLIIPMGYMDLSTFTEHLSSTCKEFL